MPEVRANFTFLGGAKVTGLPAPAAASDAAPKSYVDALSAGRDWKESVRFTTTGNVVLTGLGTQAGGDWGGAMTAGDRVLVKNNATGSENGIYTVAVGAWARAVDAATSADLNPGATVSIEEGVTLADTRWVLTTNAPINLGVTALTFTKDAGEILAGGAGLVKTGTTLDIGAGTGIIVNADSIQIDTAVVARRFAFTLVGGALTELVNHNLGTRDVMVIVYQATGAPYDEELFTIQHTDLNNVTIVSESGNIPAGYRVVVVG
jgi:hypothetical protein